MARARTSDGRTGRTGRTSKKRRGRPILVALLAIVGAGVAALAGYRQQQLAKNREEFERVYG